MFNIFMYQLILLYVTDGLVIFFFSSRRRHTRCALVTGVQTCARPICFWELLRIARWHVEGSAYDRALAMIVEAHAALPMAAFWGQGQSASSDGQFFLATEQGEAMNLINAKYGNVPGLKGYSHVSDQY